MSNPIPDNQHKKLSTKLYNQIKMCANANNINPVGCNIVKIIEKRKNNRSKFLNPSFTGNLLIVLSQLSSSISLMPINLPLPNPFLY